MTQTAVAANPREKRPTLHVGGKAPAAAPIARIVPSSPQPFPLIRLMRAAENVRHIRVGEDVSELAADIAAHGLLQSLIGYERASDDKVMIVGGGRRLQALVALWEDGRIDGGWPVPVLIRSVDDAIELSLAENLQQRTMSAVDECHAFKALMDRGDQSPAELAKRFGFSERVVRQRLRLAELAPPILDALAEREITIDAAMAYATTQDRALQEEVFRSQAKRGTDPHRPQNIRTDIRSRGMRTDDPIFRFVGAETYERDGGGYEDDLFTDRAEVSGNARALDKPFIADAAARRMIDLQAVRLVEELKQDPRYAPTIVGYVVAPALRIYGWGQSDLIKPPAGCVQVDRHDFEKTWRTIRNNGVDVHVLLGIDDDGRLAIWPRTVWVPKEQQRAIDPQSVVPIPRESSAEDATMDQRQREVAIWARRLAVGSMAGTPLEGRTFWPTPTRDDSTRAFLDGCPGWYVQLDVFVTDGEIAGKMKAGEAEYEAILAEKAGRA